MLTENMTAAEVLAIYKEDVDKLAVYLPWLKEKSGSKVMSSYRHDDAVRAVTFPVYDATLMRFIKEAQNTKLMDRNYRYVMSRNRLNSASDIHAFIGKAEILQLDQLGGILANYVLGGQTKARLWAEGMDDGIFYEVVNKAKELVDFWTNAGVMKGE